MIMETALRIADEREMQGEHVEAKRILDSLLAQHGERVEIVSRLAAVSAAAGDHRTALEWYAKLAIMMPEDANVQLLMGVEYAETGNYEAALECFQRCLAGNPGSAGLHEMVGTAFRELGRREDAIAHFREALRINPNNSEAKVQLAVLYIDRLEMGEAEHLLREVLQRDPNHALALNNLGRVLSFQGRPQMALNCYAAALTVEPESPVVADNLLLCMNYLSGAPPLAVSDEHRRLMAKLYPPPITPLWHPRDTESRLRVGYVSGDFHNHSVAFFLEPILLNHDHRRFEIYCYTNDTRSDDTTLRLRSCADAWHSIANLSDQEAAETIRSHRIDILVDLSGHTSENRLGVFARRAAPVQVSWLGYPQTTGLSQMDYYLTDGACDPPGMTESLYTEHLARLPRVFCAYLPPLEFPAVAPAPHQASGRVTFGSFNNFAKVNDETISLWSQILQQVEGARLKLKSIALGDSATRRRVLDLFEQRGVATERIDLVGIIPSAFAHLALYSEIDIALDTFPYHGTTTTCEALWMGVPVITMAGTCHASRVGVSFLQATRLEPLIAETPAAYVAKAVRLAADRSLLAELRHNLRLMLARSPLMDAAGVTREVEQVFERLVEEQSRRNHASTA